MPATPLTDEVGRFVPGVLVSAAAPTTFGTRAINLLATETALLMIGSQRAHSPQQSRRRGAPASPGRRALPIWPRQIGPRRPTFGTTEAAAAATGPGLTPA